MRIMMSILNSNDYYLEDEIKVQKLSSETLKSLIKWGLIMCIVILLFMFGDKKLFSYIKLFFYIKLIDNLMDCGYNIITKLVETNWN